MKVLTTILSNLRNTLIGFVIGAYDQELEPIYIRVKNRSRNYRLDR